jgi:hypothetical protein
MCGLEGYGLGDRVVAGFGREAIMTARLIPALIGRRAVMNTAMAGMCLCGADGDDETWRRVMGDDDRN